MVGSEKNFAGFSKKQCYMYVQKSTRSRLFIINKANIDLAADLISQENDPGNRKVYRPRK